MSKLSFTLSILVLHLTFHSIQAQPGETKTGTATISGRVTLKGEPARGVEVILVTTIRWSANAPRARTDENGRFLFTNVAAGSYEIFAVTPGYFSPQEMHSVADGVRVENVDLEIKRGGVIAGRIIDSQGRPVIEEKITLKKLDKPLSYHNYNPDDNMSRTDDRGVYRIYGLSPGTYIVFTRNRFHPFPSPYDKDGPTYYPSSTRETAAEVTVTSGGETSGVDIRYRGDRGHAVSGSISFSAEPVSPSITYMVALTNIVTGVVRSDADFFRERFAIYGVTDGEYEITVRWLLPSNEEIITSAPRRVVVKGADIGGIELKLLPMGSITGKFALEATPVVCESKRKWSLEETLLAIRPGAKSEEATPARSRTVVNGLTEKGEFTVYYLAADRYFLEPRLPNENWYVKAITAPASTSVSANTKAAAARGALVADISRNGITLKAGEKITGVVATITEGAAGLSGKVIPTTEESRLPARLRIHLVPAEARAADEVLRYAETYARSDGSFLLSNLAPGKYWLIARAAPDDETSDLPVAPIAWDANERAKLRRKAMAGNNEIELQPCGRLKDYALRFDR